MKPLPCLVVLAALVCGCVAPDEERPPDIRVVVIETNIPDEVRDGCDHRYEYPGEIAPRPCDELGMPPTICSKIALCPAQVDAIFDAFLACEQPEGAVDPEGLPSCS